jgi:hypothetical protein
MLKLVGDNPFNGVSHVSQERALARGHQIMEPHYAASLVKKSIESGADGFMFSITDSTLSIIKIFEKQKVGTKLYAITPAAGEFARIMGPAGGLEGAAKAIMKQMILSGDIKAIFEGVTGVASMNWEPLMRSYIRYELSRIKRVISQSSVESIMLHEIVTDMALSLNISELFISYIEFVKGLKCTPGFETRNFVLLVDRFRDWGVDLNEVDIAAPFNSVGFQMNPSQQICEATLASLNNSNVIAISVLAAGYLTPNNAFEYIKKLNLKGVAIAVSNESQASETFKSL